jgi:hypothetical protein
MRRHLVIGLLLASAGGLSAQSPSADPFFGRLIGHWVLQGAIAGQPTTHDVVFTWLLGHEYVQMHEVSREKDAKGNPAYEAIVLFGRDSASGEYAALWLDNTGASAFEPAGIGRGRFVGDSIHFLFGTSPADRFHNTFVWHRASDTWDWQMDNDSAGVRKPFGRVTLTRR